MSSTTKPKVLLVDDEAQVVRGLTVHLRKQFEIFTATSGQAGLQVIDGEDVAAVVSDMRMPEMNGAEFLASVRERSPHTTRLLLTGQTDLESAISAVNDGQIFRFLTKPVRPRALRDALLEATRLHELETAEAQLLENTLQSSVKVLTDVLALVNPEAFSCASRLSIIVDKLCAQLGLQSTWQHKIAAMLSQLGFVALAPDVAQRLHESDSWSSEDKEAYARQANVARDLIATVPRLEGVAEMIGAQAHEAPETAASFWDLNEERMGAEMLRLACDFDRAIARVGKAAAQKAMRRKGAFPRELLEALDGIELPWAGTAVAQVTLDELEANMVLRQHVRTNGGLLLAAKGTTVSPILLQRLRSFAKHDGIEEPIEVECAS